MFDCHNQLSPDCPPENTMKTFYCCIMMLLLFCPKELIWMFLCVFCVVLWLAGDGIDQLKDQSWDHLMKLERAIEEEDLQAVERAFTDLRRKHEKNFGEVRDHTPRHQYSVQFV